MTRAMVDGAWCTDEEQRVYEAAFAQHAGLASPTTVGSAMEDGADIERKRAADDACSLPRGAAVHAVRAWRWAHRDRDVSPQKAGEWDVDLVTRFEVHAREMGAGSVGIYLRPDGTAYVLARDGDCQGSSLFAALSAWPRGDR